MRGKRERRRREGKIKRGMRSERRRGGNKENFANFSNLSFGDNKIAKVVTFIPVIIY